MDKGANPEDVDFEKVIGGSTFTNSPIDAVNNNLASTSSVSQEDFSRKTAVQCLLKGDKVFSLNWVNGGGWKAFIGGHWNRKNCKFVTGNVIVNKNWSESKLSLQIRWENGNIEELKQKSTDVAYGDRVFVLDRQCISPGSKIFLVGHPELEGTVSAKRYLATGAITCNKTSTDWVFEDIDVTKLRRENYGSGYKDNKVLYRGWLGITSGYRTRVYLQSTSEEESFFTIIVDGNISQRFNIGEEINLGFKLLRGAEFVGAEEGHTNNWLVNFFRFYNTNATVVDCETDEIVVCWIGKAVNPNAPPNQYEMFDCPDDVIPHEELCHVQYLFGDSHIHMNPKTLWIHERSNSDNPVSKDKWARKWLKVMDWDRWEYSATTNDDDLYQQSSLFKKKYLTLEIMYTRSVVDILWSNGNSSTVDSGDVIPVQVASVWSDMMRFYHGSIVRDRLDTENKEKYGIITGLTDDNSAVVNWILPNEDARVIVSTASLYNLEEKAEYDFILKANQCPLVSCGQDQKLGVVQGINLENHKARVIMANQAVKHYWPHEIRHYKCDILLCPIDSRWTLWYDHLTPPSGITQVGPDPASNGNTVGESSSDTGSVSLNLGLSRRKQFNCAKTVPLDNIFVHEEMLLRTRETSFHQALEHEIAEMEGNLPAGIWVEHYTEREDIFSTIITGPKESIFEDFIFIFDIFLMEDFPKSEPHVNFRSMGYTLIPNHLCKSGAVFLPEETRLVEEDFSLSYILNLLLEIKDFMGLPLEQIHEKNALHTIGIKPEDPEELYKFIALGVLDYSLALLRNPPKNWRPVIISHFKKTLPRIMKRFKKGCIEVRRPVATVSNEKGDLPKVEEYELVSIPWSEAFLQSVNSRMAELEKVYTSMEG